MASPEQILAEQGQCADDQLSVLETALALAALHRPTSAIEAARDQVVALAAAVRRNLTAGASMDRVISAMAETLCGTGGFGLGGDTADGHELPEALSERRGGRDTLAVLWLCVADCAGLNVEMLSFPLQALVRLGDGRNGRAIMDCADGRALPAPALRTLHKLDSGPNAELEPAFFNPLSRRDAVLRWRQGLKMRHLRLGTVKPALAVVESALLFSPNRAGLWREVGLMRLRLDDLAGAAAALEQFVQREDNVLARGKGKQLLAEVRSRMR